MGRATASATGVPALRLNARLRKVHQYDDAYTDRLQNIGSNIYGDYVGVAGFSAGKSAETKRQEKLMQVAVSMPDNPVLERVLNAALKKGFPPIKLLGLTDSRAVESSAELQCRRAYEEIHKDPTLESPLSAEGSMYGAQLDDDRRQRHRTRTIFADEMESYLYDGWYDGWGGNPLTVKRPLVAVC